MPGVRAAGAAPGRCHGSRRSTSTQQQHARTGGGSGTTRPSRQIWARKRSGRRRAAATARQGRARPGDTSVFLTRPSTSSGVRSSPRRPFRKASASSEVNRRSPARSSSRSPWARSTATGRTGSVLLASTRPGKQRGRNCRRLPSSRWAAPSAAASDVASRAAQPHALVASRLIASARSRLIGCTRGSQEAGAVPT